MRPWSRCGIRASARASRSRISSSSLEDLERELQLACALAREAGEAIEQIRREGWTTEHKEDRSPVTRADLAADRIIREGLVAAFPGDGLLTEEGAAMRPSKTGRTWIVDPLDGTRAFIRGAEGYAVQIGLVFEGRAASEDAASYPQLGVIYEPHEDRLYRALRGGGTWLESTEAPEPSRCQVSEREAYAQMPVVTSSSMDGRVREHLAGTLGLASARRIRSVGAKVGALVRGLADIYVSDHPVHLWDSCAPIVVLEEAGGRLSDLAGRRLHYDLGSPDRAHPEGPFLATNGTRHDELCRDVARTMGW